MESLSFRIVLRKGRPGEDCLDLRLGLESLV